MSAFSCDPLLRFRFSGPTRLKPETPIVLGGGEKSSLLHAADINVTFTRPKGNATFGISILGVTTAYIEFTGSLYARVGIYDGSPKLPSPATPPLNGSAPIRVDTLRLLPSDKSITLRAFTDLGVLEVYWMDGRVAITSPFDVKAGGGNGVQIFTSVDQQLVDAKAWEMGSIWVSREEVLATPRVDRSGDIVARS